ncbi:MAG: hypothetical protein JWR69_3683, partial [Pedosphaera sp.]|nr:hypothetical protein [Pedosphaera sp.]
MSNKLIGWLNKEITPRREPTLSPFVRVVGRVLWIVFLVCV